MRGNRNSRYNDSLEMFDRLLCVASYLTLGFAGFIWLIFSRVTGRHIKKFVGFNLYQSIFIGIILYLFKILSTIFLNIVMLIPGIKLIVGFLVFYLANYQFVFGFSILHFAFLAYIAYLAWFAFTGRYTEVPWISKTVRQLL